MATSLTDNVTWTPAWTPAWTPSLDPNLILIWPRLYQRFWLSYVLSRLVQVRGGEREPQPQTVAARL